MRAVTVVHAHEHAVVLVNERRRRTVPAGRSEQSELAAGEHLVGRDRAVNVMRRTANLTSRPSGTGLVRAGSTWSVVALTFPGGCL